MRIPVSAILMGLKTIRKSIPPFCREFSASGAQLFHADRIRSPSQPESNPMQIGARAESN
jgi:hypothetical protein